MLIVLVGFSGCGKTSAGKKLARALQYSFIDLDQYFEEHFMYSISNFFLQFGEALFRKYENELLKSLLHNDNMVISTGGGTPCFYDAMTLINEKATSIYIKLSENSLIQRIQCSKKRRPLTDGKTSEELASYIKNTLIIREPYYLQAKIHVKGETLKVKDLAKMLCSTGA